MTLIRGFSWHSKCKFRALAVGSALLFIQTSFRHNLSHSSPYFTGKFSAEHGLVGKPIILADGCFKNYSISHIARHFLSSSFLNPVPKDCCLVRNIRNVHSGASSREKRPRGLSRKRKSSKVNSKDNVRFFEDEVIDNEADEELVEDNESQEEEVNESEEDDDRFYSDNSNEFKNPVEVQRKELRNSWLEQDVDKSGTDKKRTLALDDPRRAKRSVESTKPIEAHSRNTRSDWIDPAVDKSGLDKMRTQAVDDSRRDRSSKLKEVVHAPKRLEKKQPPINYENAALRRRLYEEEYEEWDTKPKKRTRISSVPPMIGEAIYGISPVFCALSAKKRIFYIMYVQEGFDFTVKSNKKSKKTIARIVKMCDALRVKRQTRPKYDLNIMADSRPHQGLILDASRLELCSQTELGPPERPHEEGGAPPVWVALDSITDPQNLGAVMRSAYFFGASGVVVTEKFSSPLTGVVSKASAGAMESIEIRSCRFMVQFLSNSSKNGWRILGATLSSNAITLGDVSVGVPTIFVMGNEGTGLDDLVAMVCDELVTIPFMGSSLTANPVMDVESLNVSVASGILLYHLLGNRQGWVLGDEHFLEGRNGHLLEDGPNVGDE